MTVTCQVAFKCERMKLQHDKRLSCDGEEETDDACSLVFTINVNCNMRRTEQEVQPLDENEKWKV